ncbi:hypothetical protein FB566_1236 [Stackebrandtia endophytica]|uniref:Uncharacterized protein n=1 Tax=Stackebrandtia endophytica TaxID=1496996 RepID=A0A543AT15_9ACTN|nr:hypothetical protein [Stackebrandtia endophytica]TQL75724.1 hypothetical protein FB566_1236 [Stackebrandtia endophytica]
MRTPWSAGRDRRYERLSRLAYQRVPYYREEWAAAGTVAPEAAPVPMAALASGHRFVPIGADTTAVLPSPVDLFETLSLSERYTPDDVLFDVQPGLRDVEFIGPKRTGRYRVLLAADADVDPTASVDPREATAAEYTRSARPVLLADPDQLAALRERGVPIGDRVLRRGDFDDLAELDVLWTVELGYLGARRISCGRVHIRPGVDVRLLGSTTVFTRLDRQNPTLLHIAPAVPVALSPCSHHAEPALTV